MRVANQGVMQSQKEMQKHWIARGQYAAAAAETQRPPLPAELNEEEAKIWHLIVDKMPANYFALPTWPILIDLCRHVILSRMFMRQLRLFESKTNSVDLKETAWALRVIERLANAHARESRTIALLASRLKLTSLYDKTNVHQARRAFLADQKPWDVPAEPDVDLN